MQARISDAFIILAGNVARCVKRFMAATSGCLGSLERGGCEARGIWARLATDSALVVRVRHVGESRLEMLDEMKCLRWRAATCAKGSDQVRLRGRVLSWHGWIVSRKSIYLKGYANRKRVNGRVLGAWNSQFELSKS